MVALFKPMEDLPCVPKLRIRGIKKCVAKLPREPRFIGPWHLNRNTYSRAERFYSHNLRVVEYVRLAFIHLD